WTKTLLTQHCGRQRRRKGPPRVPAGATPPPQNEPYRRPPAKCPWDQRKAGSAQIPLPPKAPPPPGPGHIPPQTPSSPPVSAAASIFPAVPGKNPIHLCPPPALFWVPIAPAAPIPPAPPAGYRAGWRPPGPAAPAPAA